MAAILGMAACGGAPQGSDGANGADEATGQASIALTTVPSDAACIIFSVASAGGAITTATFDVHTGASSSYSLGTLPLGNDVFSGVAYPTSCETSPLPAPTWVAPGVTSTVRVGAFTNVTLEFRRDDPTTATANFVENVVNIGMGADAPLVVTSQQSYPGVVRVFGNGVPAPSAPPGVGAITTATAVGGGWNFGCALLSAGTVSCWGNDPYGNVGPGETVGSASNTPFDVGLSHIQKIVVANSTACAIDTSENAWCWGSNPQGMITSNTGAPSYTATPVSVGPYASTRALALGGSTMCLVNGSGFVSCQGSNAYGQLGNGTTTAAAGLVTVGSPGAAPLTGMVDVTAGGLHACTLGGNGSVWCWGYGFNGQLGNGLGTNSSVPVPVTLPGPAAQIAASYFTTCARLTTGAVYCWGDNSEGEIGDGTATNRLTPTAVTGLVAGTTTNLVSESGGANFCVQMQDLTVRCWGDNTNHEIDSTGNQYFVPEALNL